MRSTLFRFSRFAFPLALALPAGWLALDRPDAAAAVVRERATPSATSLQLGGTAVGVLRSASGGTAVASVVTDAVGPGAPAKKHISGVSYENIQLELDLSLERPVYDWIGAAWAGNAQRKSGTLVSLDLNGNAKGAREFKDALITEVGFPAFDAASREPGFIALVLAPERVTSVAASAGKGALGARSKNWISSNFKLDIDGLDASRVIRIEPITFKQPVAGESIGQQRENTRAPAAIQIENLRITLSETGSDSWRAWHEDFVIKGNSAEKNERSGHLSILGQNMKEELARIDFSNLGIVALRPKAAANGVGQLEAELYVERIGLSVGGK
ncbi:MAG TPA: phage tail protein [Polyangiaceae bacterium]|nr:phage tail protein [Polyangiaceae bacterium]